MLQHARLSVVSFLLSAGTVGLFAVRCSNAFNPAVFHQRRPSTALFLEDDIADMIDKELQRQKHLKEFENEWMEKNKGAVLQKLNDDYMITMEEDELRQNFRQKLKDKKLAEKDPYAYCADRCIATGNCDVYEDLYVLKRSRLQMQPNIIQTISHLLTRALFSQF